MKLKKITRAVSLLLVSFFMVGMVSDSKIFAKNSSNVNDVVKEIEINVDEPIHLEGERISINKAKLGDWVKNLSVDDIITNYSSINLETFDMSLIKEVVFSFSGENVTNVVGCRDDNYMDSEWATSSDDNNYYYDMGYRHSGKYVSTGISFVQMDENNIYMVIDMEVDNPEWILVNPDEVFLVDLDRYNIKVQKNKLLKYYNALQWSYKNSETEVSERQIDIYDDNITSIELYNGKDKTLISKYDMAQNSYLFNNDSYEGYIYFDFGTGSERAKGRYSNLCMNADKVIDADGNITLRFYLNRFGQNEILPEGFNTNYPSEVFPIMEEDSYRFNFYKNYKGNSAVIDTKGVKKGGSYFYVSEGVTYSSSTMIGIVGDHLNGNGVSSIKNMKVTLLVKHGNGIIGTKTLSVTNDFEEFHEKNMNGSFDDDVAYYNYFISSGTKLFSPGVNGVLILPNCYSTYSFESSGSDGFVFNIPDMHYLGEPTTEWSGSSCKFIFPCNNDRCSYTYTTYGDTKIIERQEATCMEDGYTIYESTCRLSDASHPDCTYGGIHKDTLKVKEYAKGHVKGTPQKENEIPSTCTSGGSYDLVTRCSRCNKVLGSEHVETTALGHNWNSDDWELVKDSDITEELFNNSETKVTYDKSKLDKLYIHYCSRAQDAYELVVVPHGHTLDEGTIKNEVKATCTENGSYDIEFHCTECGELIATNHYETEALGHAGGGAVTENFVSCTCTEDGGFDEVVYCTRCDVELSRTHITIPAHGHTFNEWHTIKEPTVEEEGTSQRECVICGITEQKPIPKLDSSDDENNNEDMPNNDDENNNEDTPNNDDGDNDENTPNNDEDTIEEPSSENSMEVIEGEVTPDVTPNVIAEVPSEDNSKVDEADNTSENNNAAATKTGDNENILIYFILIAFSVVLVLAGIYRKNKENNL